MLRLEELLFPSFADVAVLSVDANIEIVRVDAQRIADGAVCPVRGVWSNRVHGSSLRFPADVPSGGRSVALQLRIRRVVGVDEYATRKGRHCGAVLVDIETRRPVDLLPDREASVLLA
ncbi:hypothetical protein SUDANB176_07330 [Streptomyces sp. enrichment culture]